MFCDLPLFTGGYTPYLSLGHQIITPKINQRGIQFTTPYETFFPNLDNVCYKKSSLISTFKSKKSRFSTFEHILATLYAKGLHNCEVSFSRNSPIQYKTREKQLCERINSRHLGEEFIFQESFMLPQKQWRQGDKTLISAPNSEEALNITVDSNYNGITSRYVFSPEKDDYESIASSRAYSRCSIFNKLGYISDISSQESVDELTKHAVVDILGAIALLANTKKAKVVGNFYCYLAGHRDHLNFLSSFK